MIVVDGGGHDSIVNFFSADRLLNTSFEELLAFQRALKEFVGSADPVYSKQYEEFFIGLEGRQVLFNVLLPFLSLRLKRF